jgi:PilZ domain-containing protein
MSTTKLDTSGIFKPVTVRSDRTTLSLPQSAVCIRKSGIEFRSPTPIPVWTEMTVTLESSGEAKKVNCTGIVVACDGNRHTGYAVSMLFMNLSRQSQERLNLLAYSQFA